MWRCGKCEDVKCHHWGGNVALASPVSYARAFAGIPKERVLFVEKEM